MSVALRGTSDLVSGWPFCWQEGLFSAIDYESFEL